MVALYAPGVVEVPGVQLNAPVVGSIDTVDLLVDEVDGLTDGLRQAERHLLSTNGSVKQLDDN